MTKLALNPSSGETAAAQDFSLILKELMNREGINATEFARRVGIPQPSIHRLLMGKTEDPKLSTLLVIAEYFGVSIDQLIGNTPLAINSLQNKNKISLSLPIISWGEAITKSLKTKLNTHNGDECFLIDIEASPFSFGLKSKRSMEPRFPIGSLLVVDPEVIPSDGDLVIVHYKNTPEATLREIILDGPKQRVQIINDHSLSEELTSDIKVIGVVIQTRFSYK